VRLIITGTVQGVFYRSWTVETASGLGLDGWVRNNADGTVEAVAAGPAEAVDRLVAACHDGPPAARVDGVDVLPADDPGGGGFRQA
jgi:acylphosphatase